MNYISHSCGVYRYKDTRGNTYNSTNLAKLVRMLSAAGFSVYLDTMMDVRTAQPVLLYVVTENK